MKFKPSQAKPSHNLSYDTLTENGQEIYNELVARYELPKE